MSKTGFRASDDEAKYLTDKGWTVEMVPLGDGKIPMWQSPDGLSMSLALALPCQKNRDARLERIAVRTRRDDIFCNKCGDNLKVMDGDDCVGYYGLVFAELTTGYWSKHLPDTHRYIFSMCEKCMAELFKTFMIPPLDEFTL